MGDFTLDIPYDRVYSIHYSVFAFNDYIHIGDYNENKNWAVYGMVWSRPARICSLLLDEENSYDS